MLETVFKEACSLNWLSRLSYVNDKSITKTAGLNRQSLIVLIVELSQFRYPSSNFRLIG